MHCFSEVIQEYRLTTEQASTLKTATKVFAYVEEFSCKPPTFVMMFLTLTELVLYLFTVFTMDEPITWTGPVPYCSSLIYNPYRRIEVWRYVSYMWVSMSTRLKPYYLLHFKSTIESLQSDYFVSPLFIFRKQIIKMAR